MATTYHADIQKLYVAYFNRPADVSGLNFWEGVLENNGGDLSVISGEFAKANEYTDAFGGLDNAHIVNVIYNNLFGRDADVSGLNFWTNALNNGVFTVANAVTTILAGAQGSDATTFANKVTAAGAFTDALDTTAEILGYSGAVANKAAAQFLSGINTDASLEAAIAPAALDATVAGVIAAAVPATAFSLTTGTDAYVGTFGADVITAAISADGKGTLTAGDTIDGGAGVDTLKITVGEGVNSDLSVATIKNVEKIVITGSDNLGLTAIDAATLAKVPAAQAALAAATTALDNAQSAVTKFTQDFNTARGAYELRQQETITANGAKAAAAAVAALANEDAVKAAVTASASSDAGYTTAQYNAAATAALKAADGSSLDTDSVTNGVVDDSIAILARAAALASDANGKATVAANAEASAKSVNDAAQSALNAASTQLATAQNTQITAQGALATAEQAANSIEVVASVDVSKFAGLTDISVDGDKTAIKGVSTQNVTFAGAEALSTTVSYTSAATSANIALDGAGGTVTLLDNSATKTALSTLTLTGSSFIAEGDSNGSIAIVDSTSAFAGSIKTLNVALTNDTYVNVADLAKLTTVDASASTGGIGLTAGNPFAASKVTSVTTGSGDDAITIFAKTSAASGTTAAKNLTVSTGAGDDQINVYNADGSTGLTTIDAGAGDDKIQIFKAAGAGLNINGGAGNDTIFLTGAALATTDVIDGGDGNDTIAVAGTTAARVADDFIVFNKLVKNFETIKFTTAEGYAAFGDSAAIALDVSKLGANYTTIDLASDSFVANVGTQAIIANGNVDITASGYKAPASATASATYAGTVNVTELVDGGNVTVRADTVNLTIKAGVDTGSFSIMDNSPRGVEASLHGDVKTAVVTLANAVSEATDDVDARDLFATLDLVNSTTDLKSLASLTLKGTGGAFITNVDGTALVAVDASGLSNTLTVGDNAGDATTSLVYTSFNTKAETIKLGAGIDSVSLYASTYGAVDTVTGLHLVLAEDGKSIDASSDHLTIGGVSAFNAVVTKMTTTQTDLDLALKEASVLQYTDAQGAKNAADIVVFSMGGDTYVYSDADHDNAVSTNDIVVKLTGTIDLDTLVLALKDVPTPP